MKLFFHYLRKEWSFSWKLVLILFFCQLVRIPAGLGMMANPLGEGFIFGPSIANWMAGQLLFTFVFFFIFQILGAESPVARESFVATRPVSSRELGAAKLTAFLSFLLGPTLIVEGIYLSSQGFSGEDVFWGLLQLGLLLAVCFLLGAGFFWLFQTTRERLIGWGVLGLVMCVSLFLGGVLVHFLWETTGASSGKNIFDDRFSIPRMFLAATFAMVGVWILLGIYWHRGAEGLRFRVGGLALMGGLLVLGLWLVPRGVSFDKEVAEAKPVAAVAKMFEQKNQKGEISYRLEVEPLQKTLLGSDEEFFEVSSYSLGGGKKIESPQLSPLRTLEKRLNWNGSEFLDSRGFRESFGVNPICFSGTVIGNLDGAAKAILPRDEIGDKSLEIQMELTRHQLRWNKVADLPFVKGARSEGWSLNGWEDFETKGESPVIRLSERRQRNWLRGDSPPPGHRMLRVVVFDEKKNVCFSAQSIFPGNHQVTFR